ncbi:SUF system FeS assembly protein [Treponema pallidum subsp. pallidum]|uniref:Fe-S cluster assembly sulfur transfer protein SufU n=1 Tax=Treponema pallidum TaxID=160 RepID=UPI0010CA3ABE|nr:SUF system NifU family Fe-S cluster assembly protein [Treponema pallidum]QCP96865.1 SUF system FeS assembly protein [Treponema pallidum subsp. pallidum]
MNAEAIYRQVLLEYARKQEHRRVLEGPVGIERGHNPSCGDDLTLLIKREGDRIADVAFLGTGCAVSTASTNILIELIKGASVAQAQKTVALFFHMMAQRCLTDQERAHLQDACILACFASMPARIKCATLSWHNADILLHHKKDTDA